MMPGPVIEPVKEPITPGQAWKNLTQGEKVGTVAAMLAVTVTPALRKCFFEYASYGNKTGRASRLASIGPVHVGVPKTPALIVQLNPGYDIFILWNP